MKIDPRGSKQVDEADTWELWRQDGACLKWGPGPAYYYARIWVHGVKIDPTKVTSELGEPGFSAAK